MEGVLKIPKTCLPPASQPPLGTRSQHPKQRYPLTALVSNRRSAAPECPGFESLAQVLPEIAELGPGLKRIFQILLKPLFAEARHPATAPSH